MNLNYSIGRLLPDRLYLQIKFYRTYGRFIDFGNPKSFNEKMQWFKVYDRRPEYTMMVDKYEVKGFIAERVGAECIIPTLGVWDSFDEIDFDMLPDKFVLKCTHDSGGLVICRDKAQLDKKGAKEKIEKSLHRNYYWNCREWPYKNIKPRIIAESYMEDAGEKGLTDYKFFCFNGEPKLLYISKGLENHETASISFYDMNGRELPFHRSDYSPYHYADIPSNFKNMKSMATTIAEAVKNDFVRIDLYSINGKIYFSEITFSPCGGFLPFEPKEADMELGALINISKL